jgi:hypothetical protein
VRVEAAAYRGRPVYFEVMPAWREDERPNGLPGHLLQYAVLVALLDGLLLLAIRNLRRGQGDVRGTVRLGLAIVGAVVGAWLLGGHHNPSREVSQLVLLLGIGAWLALLNSLSYLALEPAVRRRWPWRLTAWNRLLDGRLRAARRLEQSDCTPRGRTADGGQGKPPPVPPVRLSRPGGFSPAFHPAFTCGAVEVLVPARGRRVVEREGGASYAGGRRPFFVDTADRAGRLCSAGQDAGSCCERGRCLPCEPGAARCVF